jgi:two-component sensor histidine kinase
MATRYEGRPAVQVMAVDITARKTMEVGLHESLKGKDLAIREIHHRVKNNLQVVSSLLRLQAGRSGNPEVIRALTEAQERIQAIALIHARLHQAPTLAQADLRDYLTRLVAQLVRSYATAPSLVDATVEVAELRLGPDELVPLALILHELILNALRHGFAPGEGGALRIALALEADGRVALRVEDDGHGLPEGLDPNEGGNLGFQLIRALTDQLRGTFLVTRRRGAAFLLSFTPRTP